MQMAREHNLIERALDVKRANVTATLRHVATVQKRYRLRLYSTVRRSISFRQNVIALNVAAPGVGGSGGCTTDQCRRAIFELSIGMRIQQVRA